jgi:LPXTG-site transpeptidase (sortase) family protein
VDDGTDSCIASVSAGICDLTSTTPGVKTLTATYTGDSNFTGSTSSGVIHTVNAAAVITSLDHANFTVSTAGPTFTVTSIGYPMPSITLGGDTLPSGITFTDNGNGSGTLTGIPATGTMGIYHIIFTATNSIGDNAIQNFTLTVAGGPTILMNGINTFNDTGDSRLDENEVVTVQLNKFIVKFSKDVIHVPDTDASYGESVINPANFMLVNGNGNGFQTIDCKSGIDPQDFAISIDSVTYSNNSGAGPFIATLSVNSGNPLANGNYRLYVCGTTSITDLGSLKLAGNGTLEGTDFIRNFSVNRAHSGGGGNNGEVSTITTGVIPVIGFMPGHSTLIPVQSVDNAYSSYNGLRIEIPALGVNTTIMGVDYKNNSWDLTWLGNNVGYLDGSAYPTWSGNSVLTGHVVEANGAPGPFAYIKDLQIGDKVNIHFGGQVFIYEVRENQQVLPTMLSTIFKHETYNWLTLVTCEEYNNITKTYNYRRYARAVLVSVVPEK